MIPEAGDGAGPLPPGTGLEVGLPDKIQCVQVTVHFRYATQAIFGTPAY